MERDFDFEKSPEYQELVRVFERIRNPEIILPDLVLRMRRLSQIIAGNVVRQLLSGRGGGKGGRDSKGRFLGSRGGALNRRTGQLAQSTVGDALLEGRFIEVILGVLRGPAGVYAAVHEYGGIIRPKKAKALKVPITGGPALTPSGVERDLSDKDLVLITRSGKPPLLYVEEDLDRGIETATPAYVLLPSVKIPERSYLRRGLREHRDMIEIDVLDFIEEQFS